VWEWDLDFEISWEWERADGNRREWECKRQFPQISSQNQAMT